MTDKFHIHCRVFKQKLQQLLEDVTKHHIFGRVTSYMYTIEFQKRYVARYLLYINTSPCQQYCLYFRGLPHAHCLFTLAREDIPRTAEQIDGIVSTEIPNPETNPKLHELVKQYMVTDINYIANIILSIIKPL